MPSDEEDSIMPVSEHTHGREDDPEFHRAWAAHWRERTEHWMRREGEARAEVERLRGEVATLRAFIDRGEYAEDVLGDA